MQVRIKFIRHGANSAVGGFAPGDYARVDEEMAKHLINEAKVAVLADPAQAKPVTKAAPAKAAIVDNVRPYCGQGRPRWHQFADLVLRVGPLLDRHAATEAAGAHYTPISMRYGFSNTRDPVGISTKSSRSA